MAELAPQRSNRRPLITLAGKIASTQRNQIRMMEEILREANVAYLTENVPEVTEIPGIQSQDQIATLRALEGDEFNRTFIDLMVAHHRGEIVLANRVLRKGQAEQVADLARTLLRSQRMQIYKMHQFYVDWYQPPTQTLPPQPMEQQRNKQQVTQQVPPTQRESANQVTTNPAQYNPSQT